MSRKSINQMRSREGMRLNERYAPNSRRRPFWLPASNYYVLSVGLTIASFFLFWGLLHDGDEAMPWIPAGIAAGTILFCAVLLREIILRRFRRRYLVAQRLLDRNLDGTRIPARRRASEARLSIEQNAGLIKRIRKKSAAAKTLMRLPEGHLEVFDFCSEYLKLTETELRSVPAGSPRIAAFRHGRDIAEGIRREHLLTWAEIEAKRLTKESANRVTISEKIESAQRALDVLLTALEQYPEDEVLISSQSAVRDMINTLRVSHWIELAERSEFKGNHRRAISHYKDALFFMARERGSVPDAEKLADEINREIERINGLPKTSKRGEINTPDND